jgi:Fe-S-cluster containining protein
MKYLDPNALDDVPGRQIGPSDSFTFRCHSGLACYNQCCRNLNLFLYPYDVLRLKRGLGIPSDTFIDLYTHVVMRPGHYFPEVLLRMNDDPEHTCAFLTPQGCQVYVERPHTCRNFPMEQGALYDSDSDTLTPVHFFRPPEFCLGPAEDQVLTLDGWVQDQDAIRYNAMTLRWARIRRLFQNDPWGLQGFEGPNGKMAFMAAYNIDRFRDFVFNSTFVKRYRIKPKLVKNLRTSDTALLELGFEWIERFVWGLPSKLLR